MSCTSIATVMILAASCAYGQRNVVPSEVLQHRFGQRNAKATFRMPEVILQGRPPIDACAIPLLAVPLKPTHDAISMSGKLPDIDRRMVVAPRVPACPPKSAVRRVQP
jgi:hypothetical protein